MKRSDAQLLVRSIARAVRERFVRRADHDELVARVAELERQIAELRKHQEAA